MNKADFFNNVRLLAFVAAVCGCGGVITKLLGLWG